MFPNRLISYLRLEVAFWQQHPQLQHMSGFILEQLQRACLARLREKVAESVRTLWSRIAILTFEGEKLFHTELSDVKNDVSGAYVGRLPARCLANISDLFSIKLEAEKEEVYMATVADSRSFLKTFIEMHISVALPELCALYPCHVRVTALSVWLIRKQATAQRGALMNFLSSYARRKLEEVSSIGAKQFKKGIDANAISITSSVPEGLGDQKEVERGVCNVELRVPSSSHITGSNRYEVMDSRLPSVVLGSHGRGDKIAACLLEVNEFFSISNPVDQNSKQWDRNNNTDAPVNEINLHNFVMKPLHISSKLIFSSELLEKTSLSMNFADVRFQNNIARLCEVVHDLLQVVAICVGDFMIERTEPAIKLIPTTFSDRIGGASNSTPSDISFFTAYPSMTSQSNPTRSNVPNTVPVSASVVSYLSTSKSTLPHNLGNSNPSQVTNAPQGKASCWGLPNTGKLSDNQGAHLRDTLNREDINLKQELTRKSQLTLAEVLVSVENSKRVLLSFIICLAAEKKKLECCPKGGSEAAGKLSIHCVKMLTSSITFLIYFDAFLIQENTQLKATTPQLSLLLNLFTSYQVSQSGSRTGITLGKYDLSSKWEKFLELDRFTSFFLEEIEGGNEQQKYGMYPSDLLIAATSLNLITPSSLGYVMTACARPSSLSYYMACKNLPVLKQRAPNLIRNFIGRHYLFSYLKNKSEENSPIAKIIYNGLYDSDDESGTKWYEQTQVLNCLKEESGDLMNILLKLKNIK